MPNRFLTLMYHDIVPEDIAETSGFKGKSPTEYKVDPILFNSHLCEIFKTIKISPSLVSCILDGSSAEHDWFITFDDGGVGSYIYAAEELNRIGWRGHFFVSTKYINEPGFLSEKQIIEMRKSGHIIGSHSFSHPSRFSSLSIDDMLKEWKDSKRMLSDLLGEEVCCGSVPGGFYSDKVGLSASMSGIKVLFTSEPIIRTFMVSNCLVLGRYTIRKNTTPWVVSNICSGRFALRSSQWLNWNAKKIAKIILGEYYMRARKMFYVY